MGSSRGHWAQVRRLMAMRQAPGWQFSTLFLVKDSLAAMLQSAGKGGSWPTQAPSMPSQPCLLTRATCSACSVGGCLMRASMMDAHTKHAVLTARAGASLMRAHALNMGAHARRHAGGCAARV